MFVLFYDAKVSGSLYAMPNRITDSSTTFTESAAFFVTSQGMGKVLNVQSVNDYARFVGAPQLHPLVSIIHYDELEHCRHSLNQYGVYGLFLMEESPYTINYGNARVQMQGGTLMGVAPGQTGGSFVRPKALQMTFSAALTSCFNATIPRTGRKRTAFPAFVIAPKTSSSHPTISVTLSAPVPERAHRHISAAS